MTKAILHIGAGKCGSSALQTALSMQPDLGDGFSHYASICSNGSLLSGSALEESAAHNPYGYSSSINAPELVSLSAGKTKALSEHLSHAARSQGRIILSNEGWINDADLFNKSDIIRRLGIECEVVCYVRPQVEWINSAWWQWGAWTAAPLARWVRNSLRSVDWHEKISKWSDVRGINKISVRLLPEDIVSDFCGLLGVAALPASQNNTSLPGSILRLFQGHSCLRPDAHSSAIDFILSRYITVEDDPTPWVLGPNIIEKIISETRVSNERLLNLLDKESRKAMADDPRWWDSSAYSARNKEPVLRKRIPYEQLDSVAAQALEAVWKLDQENRQLRKKLRTI